MLFGDGLFRGVFTEVGVSGGAVRENLSFGVLDLEADTVTLLNQGSSDVCLKGWCLRCVIQTAKQTQ